MSLTPQGESAVCRRMTGYGADGKATWCGGTLMPTAYGADGGPAQDRDSFRRPSLWAGRKADYGHDG